MRYLLASLVLAALAYGDATVDWTKLVVRATTRARNVQEEASRDEIAQQFLSALRETNYDATRSVAEYLDENPYVASQTERTSFAPRRTGTKYLTDGSVELEYEINLTGPLLEALMPPVGGGKLLVPLCCPVCHRAWPEGNDVPPGVTLVPKEEENAIPYTGILIDARGLNLVPALFPRVVDEENREAYGPGFVQRSYGMDRGLASYVYATHEAYQSERLGMNPLRISALRATGRDRTDVVISNPDAQRLHSSQRNLKLLERCQVVLIIDQ